LIDTLSETQVEGAGQMLMQGRSARRAIKQSICSQRSRGRRRLYVFRNLTERLDRALSEGAGKSRP
jgi:hypothetical protein